MHKVQVSVDDADTEVLRRLLIAAVALLLVQEGGSDALQMVEQVEDGIAKQLRQNKRTDDKAKLARRQFLDLRRIWYGALFQAEGGGIEDGTRAFRDDFGPVLARNQTSEILADTITDIALEQAHASAQLRRVQLFTSQAHSLKVDIGENHLIGGAAEVGQRNLGAGTRAQDQRAPRRPRVALPERGGNQGRAMLEMLRCVLAQPFPALSALHLNVTER